VSTKTSTTTTPSSPPPPPTQPQDGLSTDDETSLSSPLSAITSPPYWHQSHSRSISNVSVESMLPGGITLQDNTDEEADAKGGACWAKHVYIEDHTVINEGRTSIGAFVVWNITVETLYVGFHGALLGFFHIIHGLVLILVKR
jgi:hypothetical protein